MENVNGLAIVSIGVDSVDVDRIRDACERVDRFRGVNFTEVEQHYCERFAPPWERYAGRWAAKEAVQKCLGGGPDVANMCEIEVISANTAPTVRLLGSARHAADTHGVGMVHVSITHTATVATAFAVAVGVAS